MAGRKKAGVLLSLGGVFAVCAAAAFTVPAERSYAGAAMGTRVSITIRGTLIDAFSGRTGRLAAGAFSEIAAIEDLMSIYRETSDVSRLNAAPPGAEIPVDRRTFKVLALSREIGLFTGGAFNIGVHPSERAWGFKGAGERRVPAEGERVAPAGGPADIFLAERDGRTFARLGAAGMKVDLGGVAKGYAADRAAAVLAAGGARGALVQIGGECCCLGGPWIVGVRDPRGSGVITALSLTDRGVSTSGDYEDYFEEGGRRYSHIFDPLTGEPSRSGVISATVISRSSAKSDALATALVVIGERAALALVGRLGDTDCILVVEDEGGGIRTVSSPGGAVR